MSSHHPPHVHLNSAQKEMLRDSPIPGAVFGGLIGGIFWPIGAIVGGVIGGIAGAANAEFERK